MYGEVTEMAVSAMSDGGWEWFAQMRSGGEQVAIFKDSACPSMRKLLDMEIREVSVEIGK